jgi:hypothetical protein
MGIALAPMCRIGGRERINVREEHFALSAPKLKKKLQENHLANL